MSTEISDAEYDTIGCFVFLSPLFLFLIICILILISGDTRCVQLKSGVNLGYNAIFDFRGGIAGTPYITLKLPDGTPLVDQPYWSLYNTDTTVYGYTFGSPYGENTYVAWRADVGLVLEREYPALYDKLVAEAGPANEGIGTGAYGAEVIMQELMKRAEYANQTCATRWFKW